MQEVIWNVSQRFENGGVVEWSDKPGAEDRCARSPGELLGCPETTVSTPEDACLRLVACGSIPLDAENQFDYLACLNALEQLPRFRIDIALACVELSTCEELQEAVCLEYGDD